jgi:hypothetical protein
VTRYFVTTDDRGEREVDKAEFVNVERRAGFRNTMGQPDEPGTGGFGVSGPGWELRGRIEFGGEDPP